MRDNTVHAIFQNDPPQTYCGIVPFGHKTTSNPDLITCEKCKAIQAEVAGSVLAFISNPKDEKPINDKIVIKFMPERKESHEDQPRRRGRPKKVSGTSHPERPAPDAEAKPAH